MSVYHPVAVSCSCGRPYETNVVHSVNAGRSPGVRKAILEGRFHQSYCPSCGKSHFIENTFYYTDLARKSLFLVKPRNERFKFLQDSERLQISADNVPPFVLGNNQRQLRLVYGLDELREKLVAQDAGFDDEFVEISKAFILHEHPFLLHKERLQLHLSGVSNDKVFFTANHHNQPESFQIDVPKAVYQQLFARRVGLREWLKKRHKKQVVTGKSDFWVNFRQWTTRYSSLDTLRKCADAIRDGQQPSLSDPGFRLMIERLPRGAQLPSWAKADLRVLFDYAKELGDEKAQDLLFEVRYGKELDDEWARNRNPDDIDTIWQLFRDLPESNIEGNTNLKSIDLISGGGGYYQWSGVIQIGQDEVNGGERFEDLLRHEVGHSVHDSKELQINAWLESEFGWRFFPATDSGVDDWVQLMGGWGNATANEKADVTRYLLTAIGAGENWNPGPAPRAPRNHLWNKRTFGPRLAYKKTGPDWYQNFRRWHRANGMAFFCNYWYAWFMAVNEETLKLIRRMPSDYAAMSHFEFFAELYSLYYDHDDPKRKVITPAISRWLDSNIGTRNPVNPMLPSQVRGSVRKKSRQQRKN